LELKAVKDRDLQLTNQHVYICLLTEILKIPKHPSLASDAYFSKVSNETADISMYCEMFVAPFLGSNSLASTEHPWHPWHPWRMGNTFS